VIFTAWCATHTYSTVCTVARRLSACPSVTAGFLLKRLNRSGWTLVHKLSRGLSYTVREIWARLQRQQFLQLLASRVFGVISKIWRLHLYDKGYSATNLSRLALLSFSFICTTGLVHLGGCTAFKICDSDITTYLATVHPAQWGLIIQTPHGEWLDLITHADGSHGVKIYSSVCLCAMISIKNDAAGITKLDTGTFNNESWKPIYLGVKRSRSRLTETLPAWVFALLWVLASSSSIISISGCYSDRLALTVGWYSCKQLSSSSLSASSAMLASLRSFNSRSKSDTRRSSSIVLCRRSSLLFFVSIDSPSALCNCTPRVDVLVWV